MTETVLAPASDAAFARWLADRAGDALVALRETRGFADPDGLKADGDRISHELLIDELARWRPADAVLSEEGVRDGADRQAADRVWIIDPLDGTREYSEPGRTDWAVHVALWRRTAGSRLTDGRPGSALADARPGTGPASGLGGRPDGGPAGELVAGAVALPAQHVTLGTDAPPAYPPLTGDRIRLAASRSRPPSFLASLATELDAELVPMGSAGNKVAAVVQGKVDAYVHAGGQYEWDSAAPVAVAKATGLYASRIDGSALDYNRMNPRLPDLLVCRRDLADELTAALARLGVGRDD